MLDGGRFAPKRTAGEPVPVQATIFADGHDVLRAVVRWKAPGGRRWHEAPLTHVDVDAVEPVDAGDSALDDQPGGHEISQERRLLGSPLTEVGHAR